MADSLLRDIPTSASSLAGTELIYVLKDHTGSPTDESATVDVLASYCFDYLNKTTSTAITNADKVTAKISGSAQAITFANFMKQILTNVHAGANVTVSINADGSGIDIASTGGGGGGGTGNNWLINSDRRINQRSYTSASAVGGSGIYMHDGHKSGSAGGQYSFTQANDLTVITIATGSSVVLPVDASNVNSRSGSVTLSWGGTCKARVGVNTYSPTSGAFTDSDGTSGSIMVTNQTNGSPMAVEFTNGTLSWSKVEDGGTPTAWTPKDYAVEESACLQYCEQINSTQYNAFEFCRISTTTDIVFVLHYYTPKKGTPVVTFSASSDFYVNQGGPNFTCANLAAAITDRYHAICTATSTGMTANIPGLIQPANNTGWYRIEYKLN